MNSFVYFFSSAPASTPSVSPPHEKSERKLVNDLILNTPFFCMMVQTQWTFAPLDFIYSACRVIMKNIQHSKVKCSSLGRFYEGKIDLIRFHINIFYGFCWVFLPVRQTRSWVVEQCFMARRRSSLLSLACQTLGPPHSWLSPQWNSTLRSHYSDNVKLGFPSLPLVSPRPSPLFLLTLTENVHSSFPHCLLYLVPLFLRSLVPFVWLSPLIHSLLR